MTIDEMVRTIQAVLGVGVDGRPGPETWKAIYNALTGERVDDPRLFAGGVDARSEKVIANLAAEVRPYARMLVQRAAAVGVQVKVISGLRTFAQQDALFTQGRTKPGSIVTNARGGESNHNYGIAFDVGVFDGAHYPDESPQYDVAGAIGTDIGLEWGGTWSGFPDRPHFQLRPAWAAQLSEREMLAEMRERVKAGENLFA
jgi:peptidoglycan L-alanyl-D-glutamate endopeptidase CwlK